MRSERAAQLRTRLFTGDGSRVIRQLHRDELNRMIASRSVIWHYSRDPKTGEERILGVRMYVAPQQSRTAYANDCEHSSGAMKSADIITIALAGAFPRDRNASGKDLGPCRKEGFNAYEQRDDKIVGNYVDRAMSRLEEWPIVGDNKAVRVGVRGVISTGANV